MHHSVSAVKFCKKYWVSKYVCNRYMWAHLQGVEVRCSKLASTFHVDVCVTRHTGFGNCKPCTEPAERAAAL